MIVQVAANQQFCLPEEFILPHNGYKFCEGVLLFQIECLDHRLEGEKQFTSINVF